MQQMPPINIVNIVNVVNINQGDQIKDDAAVDQLLKAHVSGGDAYSHSDSHKQ